MLDRVKAACGVTDSKFDAELQGYIASAYIDLANAGVKPECVDDQIINTAVILYCRTVFRSPDDYERLQKMYDNLKATLRSSTGYTDWGET